ncbi:hypothetical protein GGI25_005187 [Coemansia spiralis]|uniref:Rab5-interacting protein n=2 Tax=Coemansia TaxID=4863 RepID=A0A9W8G3C0_9FUNG|nr:hypothetical protein BX070DRAFT_225624 [Coemansia spiralis]KAJ1992267.1 hypothetical protein EDC05_002935 [Coemansia umbellata]KAJ2623381.1 hypothetical protein GGI26_002419 [Coemansia sp. RSA 1358]KAJ2672260.1 hypothetical protein GGI25_005187 [Coemansia spiralis]
MGASSQETERRLTVWQKAFMRDQEWRKDELRDAVFWVISAFSLVLGLLFGVVGISGLPGFVVFFSGVVVVPSIYYASFLGVDDQDYGGKMEVLGDSVGAGAAVFVLAWTGIYTMLHGL